MCPPLVAAVWSGNPHIVVVALLLGRAAFLAPILKIYGAVPLIGERRWSALLLSGALVAVTVVAAPGLWRDYLTQAADVSARLVAQAGPMSAYGFPILMALVAFVLALLFSRRELGWLAVPALWPGTEFIYSSMALPVITPGAGNGPRRSVPGIPGHRDRDRRVRPAHRAAVRRPLPNPARSRRVHLVPLVPREKRRVGATTAPLRRRETAHRRAA